jgi:hypothetical protein
MHGMNNTKNSVTSKLYQGVGCLTKKLVNP